MKCVICKHGETKPGTTTVTFERNQSTVVIKDVPADVCDNCGETYISSTVSSKILNQADNSINQGVEVDIRKYSAA